MAGKKACSDCVHSHDCRAVYQQLGAAAGPSVAAKVFVAFLLPLIVFIIALAICEFIVGRQGLQRIFSVILAIGASFVCVMAASVITDRRLANRSRCEREGEKTSQAKAD